MKSASDLLFFVCLLSLTTAAVAPAEVKKHRRGTGLISDKFGKGPKSPKAAPQLNVPHPTTKQAPLTAGERAQQAAAGGAAPGAPGGIGDALLSSDLCAHKHSIESFLQIASATHPQAARKGGVFFLSDLREAPQVFFLKSPDTWPDQISFFPDGAVYFRVSPDGEKLLVASHVGGDEQYDIHLVEPAKKASTPLLVDRATRIESVGWGPDSSWFVYTSNARNRIDFDLHRYDLKTGKTELLTELSGYNSVSDVSPKGDKVAIDAYRSVTDSDVLVWDMAAKTLTNLTRHSGPGANGEARFSGDSAGVFYLSDMDKGVRQLYYLKLDAKAPGRIMTNGEWEVESLELDHTRTSLAYLVNEEGYSRLSGFVVDAQGHKKTNLPVPKIDDGVLRSVSFGYGADRRAFFYSFTSAVRTADIWQFKSSKTTQWTRSTQSVRTECFGRERLVRYPSFDQRSIPAFLYLPPNTTGPVPFILYVHGGPESQYRPSFGKTFQYFLERGFGVLATNIRGSTGYGREYTLADNYKKRMDSVQDVIEGAKWLISQGHTRSGKIAIYGGSYGGFLVLRSLQVEPDLFAAASESVGITDFVSFLKNTKPYRKALREAEYGPATDTEFLKSISPMTYLEKIKTPLLIFHGANDSRVPVSETEQVVKALKKRDIPVEHKIFADEGHGNRKLGNIMEQARTMVYFFEKHINKDSTTTTN